jgi:type I restriction enzyme, S subunit
VGLEHIPSSGSALLGRGSAADSISTNNAFQAGDTLFGKLRPRLRKSVRVNFDGYCSTDILVLRANESASADFASFVLRSESVFAEAIRTEEGTKMPRCSWRSLRQVKVFCPHHQAQGRIAEILSTLDEAIEQTEALIAKQQQIKAGLMHDLFTRGVTPDGHLRPTPEQASNLYKDSPLGWIPKDWEVKSCSEICEKITVGIVVRPTQYYTSEGIPAFRSANIREEGIDASDLAFISAEANVLLAKSQVQAGDVISVRTGYPGTSAVVPNEFAGSNCVDVLISRPKSSVRSNFLVNWINSSFGKDQVLRKQGGLAQQHFNVGELRDLRVVLPQMTEQDAFVDRLAVTSARIEGEQFHLAKLRQQKHGLMHDLLTGRVRVKVAEPAEVSTARTPA